MSLKLQKESPADSDLFHGESHKQVAEKMAEIITTTDIHILGLEGELGSGKSTIIHLLRKKLPEDFTFIDFDAERYHYGNTKKALIEVIYKGISQKEKVDHQLLEGFRDRALGNIVEYKKTVSSRLSWWTVSFILTSLLSVQMIRYLLSDLNSLIQGSAGSAWPVVALEVVALLSPGILLGLFQLIKFLRRNTGGMTGNITSVGDLFKRNSTDSISENWHISREIGTLELTAALDGFTAKKTVPADARFILIIDNLDRIPADKVKELWSDMELISGATHEQFRIVVPYSAAHVSDSLSVAGHSGREFISKRIPVTFTVPPLISAGWQDAFRVMWKETVDEHGQDTCCMAVIQLIERWRPLAYPRITPRLLKKIVNDIHILDMTVPGQDALRHVMMALYILAVRHNEIPVTGLLSFSELSGDPKEDGAEEDTRLRVTQEYLHRLFEGDTQRWSELLMSIHFQADPLLARSELFDTPILTAVNTHDAGVIEELARRYGFSNAWQRCALQMSMTDWLITVAKLSADASVNVSEQVDAALKRLNFSYAVKHREEFNEAFSLALFKLREDSYLADEAFIVRQKKHIIQELREVQSSDDEQSVFIADLMNEANIYSKIFAENLLRNVQDLSGEIYARYLYGKNEKLSYLQITTLKLSETEKETMLRRVITFEGSDIFSPDVSHFFGLSSPSISQIIKDDVSQLSQRMVDTVNNVQTNTPVQKVSSLRLLALTRYWQTPNVLSNLSNQTFIRENHPEEFAAHLVAYMVSSGGFTRIGEFTAYKENKKYIESLSNYFIFAASFSRVMDSLKDKNARDFVSQAIGKLLHEKRISHIHTQRYIEDYYVVVKELFGKESSMELISTRSDGTARNINAENFEDIDPEFIEDVFSDNNVSAVLNKLMLIAGDCFCTEEDLYAAFSNISENCRLVLSHMPEHGYHATMDIGTSCFADWYRKTEVAELSSGNNLKFLWSALAKVQQAEILKELHDVLLETETLKERRIKIIQDFEDVLLYLEPEGRTSRRAIAALFSASLENQQLNKWLNRLRFSLSRWPSEDAQTVCNLIMDHQESFTGIIAASPFVRKRIN